MEIDHLMWKDITITTVKSKEVVKIPCGQIHITKHNSCTTISVKKYSSAQGGVSLNNNFLFSQPKLTMLNPWQCEFEAWGWGNKKRYKVIIAAKF